MKRVFVTIFVAVILGSGLVGCKEIDNSAEVEFKKASLVVTLPVREFPFVIKASSFSGIVPHVLRDDAKVLYEDNVVWDHEAVLKTYGVDPKALTRVKIKDVSIVIKDPEEIDLSVLKKISVYVSAPLTLVAEGGYERAMGDRVTMVVLQPDFLKFFEAKEIPVQITYEGSIPRLSKDVEAGLNMTVEVSGKVFEKE